MNPKPERVALYCRVSSAEQQANDTISLQTSFLSDYCRLYGHEIVDVYRDEAVSGTVALPKRPEGARMLSDASQGLFDTVLVYRLDRVGRSLLVVVDAHDLLGEAGVAMKSATEPIDTSTPAGRLIFQMLASFSEFERASIVERSTAGLRRAFKEGRHLGRIPFGYDVNEAGDFVVVEEEAEIVREMFQNVADGTTLYSEATRLNNEGIPSPGFKYRNKERKRGPMWGHTSVRSIVKNPAYAGVHVIKSSGGEIERPVPRIVSDELRDRVLARLEESRLHSGGRPHRDYLLRGLVKCGHCGTAYVGNSSGNSKYRYHYYACRKKGDTSDLRNKSLRCPKINAERLEEIVWNDIKDCLSNPGEVLRRVSEGIEEPSREALEERRKSLSGRLESAREEKSRYVKLFGSGHLSDDELETHLSDLKNRTANLEMLLASVDSDLASVEGDRLAAKNAAAQLLSLRGSIAETENDFEAKRNLVRGLVERILVYRDEGKKRIRIDYRFADGVQNSEELSTPSAFTFTRTVAA